MINLKLQRIFNGVTYTIGKLYLNDIYICDTIEDKVRPKGIKINGVTAIQSGTYKVVLTLSNRFKRLLPLLIDVPMFTGVRLHSGNTDKDSSGCIVVGENKIKGMVINSKIYETKLIELLKHQSDISIHIIDVNK